MGLYRSNLAGNLVPERVGEVKCWTVDFNYEVSGQITIQRPDDWDPEHLSDDEIFDEFELEAIYCGEHTIAEVEGSLSVSSIESSM